MRTSDQCLSRGKIRLGQLKNGGLCLRVVENDGLLALTPSLLPVICLSLLRGRNFKFRVALMRR